ncbi:LysR family transcriptional regulator [Crenobacter sp. SG2303]|uniref:LysR family transcriptional regulator n=1 Tax=Crenobacter oryzisoli TaxID=3056844 RepID=A0ABT7XI38_9NEIS|nr:LysR family transcriptional regulator [Crenobacter sp. SG2303]MDN0073454.1 LysR family transcriptional regulator [Crenobacter sp. SG2303]
MDKLRAMQTFVAIVDEGSLTAAARVLDSSLPAVVRTLAALEETLKVRLLNRTTRRLSLTIEGQAYLDSCRHILGAVDEAEQRLTEQHGEPSGKLVVTAPVLFGQMYVAPAVTRFLQRYPGVSCRLIQLDRVVNLLEEGIDVGIRISPLEDSTLVAQTVGEIHRVVVASPAFLGGHGSVQHPRELLSANCLRSAGTGRTSWTFYENGREIGLAVSGNLELNHSLTAVEACVAGVGYGQFLSYQVAPYLADGRLVRVLEAFQPPPRPVSIVYPHAKLLPLRTRLFIDWMKRELGTTLGG